VVGIGIKRSSIHVFIIYINIMQFVICKVTIIQTFESDGGGRVEERRSGVRIGLISVTPLWDAAAL
jgi:hypothetical protein